MLVSQGFFRGLQHDDRSRLIELALAGHRRHGRAFMPSDSKKTRTTHEFAAEQVGRRATIGANAGSGLETLTGLGRGAMSIWPHRRVCSAASAKSCRGSPPRRRADPHDQDGKPIHASMSGEAASSSARTGLCCPDRPVRPPARCVSANARRKGHVGDSDRRLPASSCRCETVALRSAAR